MSGSLPDNQLQKDWQEGWDFLRGQSTSFRTQLSLMRRPENQKAQLYNEWLYRLITANTNRISLMGIAYRGLNLKRFYEEN